MSTRLLPALAVGIALLVTACSSGGDGGDSAADTGGSTPGIGGLQPCGPTKEDSVDTAHFPCVPIPKPEGSRS